VDILVGDPAHEASGFAYLVFAPPSGVVHLSEADATFYGEADGGAAGSALGTGDLDDDGRDDVLVLDASRENGTLYVVADVTEGNASLGDATVRAHGEDDRLIGSFSARGDLDDDGAADLLVGLSLTSGDAGERAALVFFGPLTGDLLPDDADAWIDSEFLYANAGLMVAAGGDVNRDGADDMLLGAPAAEVMASPDFTELTHFGGSAFVVLGPIGAGEVGLSQANLRLFSSNPRDLEKFTVSFAGDVDRDGREDMLIGAWRNDDVGTNAGLVWMLSGDRL
jgi:hypothetical protein